VRVVKSTPKDRFKASKQSDAEQPLQLVNAGEPPDNDTGTNAPRESLNI
jgi:hypothetical protein